MANRLILKHYGVIGQKWGVRKEVDRNSGRKSIDYQREGFVIKSGSELHRISVNPNETHKGSGYASFLKEDADFYNSMGKTFSKVGMKHYDMTLKANKDLISPTQKERVDIFLKKMDDKTFATDLKKQQSKMFLMNLTTPNDIRMAKEYNNLSLKQAKQYRMLNLAIAGNRNLRSKYLDEFKKLNYDFILDEADSVNKQSTAPIIFLERSNSLTVINVQDL